MQIRPRLLTVPITSALLFFTLSAWAQAVPQPPPLTSLTPTSVTISLLAALTALAVNAYNSGTILGITTTPQAVLPYLGVIGPFLTSVTVSITQAGALTGASILNAILAGFYTLVGSAVGASVHTSLQAHFTLHAKTLAARIASVAVKASMLLAAIAFAATATACSASTLQKIESGIETGLENGTLLANLEGLIVSFDPQLAGQLPTVDTILQGIITWLLQNGTLTAQGQTHAKALLAEIQTRLATSTVKTSNLSPIPNERALRQLIAGRIDR